MASDSDDEFVDSVLNVLKKESSSTLIRVEPTRAARPSIYIDKEENEAQIENDKTGSKPTRELNQAVMLVECSAEVTLTEGLTLSDIVNNSLEVIDETINEADEIGLSDISLPLESSVSNVTGTCDDLLKDPDFFPDLSNLDSDSEDVDDPGIPADVGLLSSSDLDNNIIESPETPPDILNVVSNRQNENNVSDNDNCKRRKKAEPDKWEVNVTKRKRMFGQQYNGFKRTKTDNGKMIVTRGPEKENRKVGPPCTSDICKKSKKRHCENFSDEDRNIIFKEFWNMTWKEKQVYVKTLVSITTPKTRKGKDPTRRSGTFFYHLKHKGITRPVCKKFFLNTLGIKEWMAHNWVGLKKNREDLTAVTDTQDDIENSSTRCNTEETPVKKGRLSEKKLVIEEWLNELPKLPAHYCRKDSKKLYLEPIWDTKVAVYNKYKNDCISQNKQWSSKAMFFEIFDSKNIAIYTPRKDQCDLCCGYKSGNVPAEIWQAHITEKDLARKEKEIDKQLALDGKSTVLQQMYKL